VQGHFLQDEVLAVLTLRDALLIIAGFRVARHLQVISAAQ
jgi:hypothetical protein